ncbi:hypothetical protein M5K25_006054 [Dendrobium thyrsiflorum]|uniref:Protein kinase domain-containing protein n=1 Tax=Dendrobium thyrsiflorum TaxID=117978 RepID=A0ABD0VHJ5_DENTH
MCNLGVEGFSIPKEFLCFSAAAAGTMDSPALPSPGSGDERGPRAKFLCSFGGSILPRPLDGKLRYVGGETRIVTVPHDVSYEDLLARMREIFEDTSVIKYKQPEEDLDALVSVVNDDDVMNMMEEYEKLSTIGDGFTRLRIFLFSQFPDADEAIAAAHFDADERETGRRYVDALNSLPDVKSQSPMDFADQFLSHRPLHLNVPQPAHGQKYGEVDNQWSPAYFSPGYHGAQELREYPGSPSSVRCRNFGIGEFPDHSSIQIEHQSTQAMENVIWMPPGAIIQENSGFPIHLGYHHNAYEGNAMSEHSHMTFKRGQTPMPNSWFPDSRFKHGQHYFDLANACAECYHGRDPYILNQDRRMDHGVFIEDSQRHDGSWILHTHHNNMRMDDSRVHLPKPGRGGEHYAVDANAVNSPYVHGNFCEGNEVYQAQQTDRAIPQMHADGFEDNGVRYGNQPSVYGEDSFYQFQHNLPPLHLRRKVQVPLGPGTSYELPGLLVSNGAMASGPVHGYQDGSPKLAGLGMDVKAQSPWATRNGHLSQNPAASASHNEHDLRANSNACPTDTTSENPCLTILAPLMPNGNQFAPTCAPKYGALEGARILEKNGALAKRTEESSETTEVGDSDAKATVENADIRVENLEILPELIASAKKVALEGAEVVKAVAERDTANVLTVENAEEPPSSVLEQGNAHAEGEVESDGDDENKSFSRIEPTAAETEALAKGLQTIQNDDLEEIKELGSGTYGAVYHSKWRGSDVAVKRIKASCFAGKPSERERLIADFWKEALILSSLHHPNVVSFYGVVRDGPDGSLATVTEFMVNGSLKQFLQKKDRTIDRRKRLIIAMDVAFGMEYLHEKNIVHFDLKCENLLVNMRDPHRPICKIGDLGLSKVKQHTLVSGGVRGTLPWMAPELLSGKTSMVSEKIDVYSFGIVMWELLTGEEPYSDRHCASIIGGIVNCTLRPEIPSWCDPEWKSLMEICWSSDPTQRPSFSEISQRLRKMAAAINVK